MCKGEKIFQNGSIINCKGFELVFPENSFIDSLLDIYLYDMDTYIKDLYAESRIPNDAIPITDSITDNQYTFIVNNNPLPTPNISYIFTLPVPQTIINACPTNYEYEIFIYAQQQESANILWPLMLLIDSVESLTAEFFPEIWMNKEAEFVVSCTPGSDTTRSAIIGEGGGRRRRRRLQTTVGNCPVDAIQSPLANKREITRKFNKRDHVGVDYAVDSSDILAAANGTVIKSGNSSFYGPRIILMHDNGIMSIFVSPFEDTYVCFKTVSKSIIQIKNRWSNNI